MSSRSFRHFVEHQLGTLPHFLIYAVLEWILIALLFLDGFLTFLCNQFAKIFELRVPCLLCTRIDHILLHKNSNSYYNESICEDHKKNISALAYCHVHRRLSDIKSMCEGCLLSFATGKDSDPDTQKSLHGFVDKERDRVLENDLRDQLRPVKIREDDHVEKCSCCGDLLKTKHSSKGVTRNSSINARLLSQLPAASPRGVGVSWRFDDSRQFEHVRYSELKLVENETDLPEDETGHNAASREGTKGDEITQELQTPRTPRTPRTPGLIRGNKFFGIPLTDSAAASPRAASRFFPKKPQSEKPDTFAEPNENVNESEGDSLLNRLKKQVRLDQKSLIDLYMELDEERSASAVAANNAMAMITRLQAEKASVQMEALQYQRMMEEQAEYDQEALQLMKDLLDKREEEMKGLEDELDTYRLKYGPIEGVGSDECELDGDDDYQEYKCRSVSSMSNKSDGGADPNGQFQEETAEG